MLSSVGVASFDLVAIEQAAAHPDIDAPASVVRCARGEATDGTDADASISTSGAGCSTSAVFSRTSANDSTATPISPRRPGHARASRRDGDRSLDMTEMCDLLIRHTSNPHERVTHPGHPGRPHNGGSRLGGCAGRRIRPSDTVVDLAWNRRDGSRARPRPFTYPRES